MTPEEKENVRTMIVEAAATMFGKYGYKKTTMDDIALASKKGKTAIYYYYKNKEDIFRAVIEKEARMLGEEILRAVSKEQKPVDKLKAYISARMHTLKNVATFYNAMKSELLDHLNFMNKTRMEYDKAELMLVSSILMEGVNQKQFSISDIESTATTIVALLKGMEIPLIIETAPSQLDDKLGKIINLLYNGILKR